jgi:universal stress protein E
MKRRNAMATESGRKILAGTDFSPAADEAVRQAHERADATGAELIVCHVIPNELRSNPLFPQRTQTDLERIEAIHRRVVDLVIDRVSSLTGRGTDRFSVLVDDGSPGAVIVNTAEGVSAYLIVVGHVGDNGRSGPQLGSVARRIARHAHCPVLVARPHRGTRAVVVGTDFSDPSLPAVAAAAEEARRIGGRLTVVHSIEPVTAPMVSPEIEFLYPPVTIPQRRKELRAAAEERLAVAFRQLGLEGERRVEDGPAAAALVRIAGELNADLLVAGTQGRTGLTRALLGSVAEEVIEAAPCAVLVVRLHRGVV